MKAEQEVMDKISNLKISNGKLLIGVSGTATSLGAIHLKQDRFDEDAIGRACIQHGILAITTLSGANAAVRAIRLASKPLHVDSIQNYHA